MSSNTEHVFLQVTPGGLYFIAYAENREKEREIFDEFAEILKENGILLKNIESGWCG